MELVLSPATQEVSQAAAVVVSCAKPFFSEGDSDKSRLHSIRKACDEEPCYSWQFPSSHSSCSGEWRRCRELPSGSCCLHISSAKSSDKKSSSSK